MIFVGISFMTKLYHLVFVDVVDGNYEIRLQKMMLKLYEELVKTTQSSKNGLEKQLMNQDTFG
jgi:hypothetical protein